MAMRCLILLISALGFAAGAKEKPKMPAPKVEELQAEIELLKAQLQASRLELAYEKQACAMPDLMQARLAVLAADQKLKAAAAASTKPTPEPGSQTKEKR